MAPVNPLVVAGITGGTRLVGALLGRRKRRRARAQLREARQLSRSNKALRAIQRRRQFMRQARLAQAAATLTGVASGADFGSSAAQANLASLSTQQQVGVSEQEEAFLRGNRIEDLTGAAQGDLQSARTTEAAANIGADIIGEFLG